MKLNSRLCSYYFPSVVEAVGGNLLITCAARGEKGGFGGENALHVWGVRTGFPWQLEVKREQREGGINRLQYCLINTPRQGTILPFAHQLFCLNEGLFFVQVMLINKGVCGSISPSYSLSWCPHTRRVILLMDNPLPTPMTTFCSFQGGLDVYVYITQRVAHD